MFAGVLAGCLNRGLGQIQNVDPPTGAGSGSSMALLNDGTYSVSNGFGAATGPWVLPAVYASRWDVRMTVTSGAINSGTTGTWLNLGTSRTWISNAGAVVTLEYRDSITGNILFTQSGIVFSP
jgi:hypothetical protein